MHDIRAIRDDPGAFDAAMTRRGLNGAAAEVLARDDARRAAIHAAETARADQKAAARDAGAAKAAGDDARFAALRATAAARKDEIAALEAEAARADAALADHLLTLPNILAPDVPDGLDETANVELRRLGTPPAFDFAPLQHYDIPAATAAGGLDFATAAKLSGARFVLMRGAMARLHRALAQFMLDLHTTEHGLTEVNGPVMVRDAAMTGTGQLPKFAEDSYRTSDDLWLIPTSEVTLTNTVAGLLMDAADLPIRMCAHSLCFRSEAGSAGRDTAGMLRQHQFEKVEMVSIVAPEDSAAEHARMTRQAETVLERSGPALPHDASVQRRHGLRRHADPRHRGLAARPGHLPRDLVGVRLRPLPGTPHERPRARRRRQAAVPPHAERIRSGRRAHADRGAGKRPAGRRIGRAAARPRPLDRRRHPDHVTRRAGLILGPALRAGCRPWVSVRSFSRTSRRPQLSSNPASGACRPIPEDVPKVAIPRRL